VLFNRDLLLISAPGILRTGVTGVVGGGVVNVVVPVVEDVVEEEVVPVVPVVDDVEEVDVLDCVEVVVPLVMVELDVVVVLEPQPDINKQTVTIIQTSGIIRLNILLVPMPFFLRRR
jgi:hypothetical protein